jgi:hypothetical protein
VEAIGLWGVDNPTFSKQSAQRWRWGYQPYIPAGCTLPPEKFLVLISVRGSAYLSAIMRLEGLSQLENSMTVCGIDLTTSNRLVARCLYQLRYGVLPHISECVRNHGRITGVVNGMCERGTWVIYELKVKVMKGKPVDRTGGISARIFKMWRELQLEEVTRRGRAFRWLVGH